MKRINELKGYEGVKDIYLISKEGEVFSEHLKKFLSVGDNGRGYRTVALKLEGVRKWKKAYIHRLVAMAFIPNDSNLPEVNHKDEDKDNNRVENLEWITRIDNVNHGTGTARQVYKRTTPVYVYDFLLNLVGEYRGMNQASIEVLGYSETRRRNRRIKNFFFLSEPLNIDLIIAIDKESGYQSVVMLDVQTGDKRYFASKTDAASLFDGKVNITNAVDQKWLVRKRYRFTLLDYSELKDSPILQEKQL